MYKVLPCIAQLRQYSLVKRTIVSLENLSYYQVSWTPFYYYMIKTIQSEAKLHADQDGA